MKISHIFYRPCTLCLIFIGAITTITKAQNMLDESIKALASVPPQEKIHLHLDKPYYAAGDIIWLKAYIVDYASNKPSANSGVLYAELINQRSKVSTQLKLPIKGGTAWGNIELPDTLSEGNYRLRAYTQLMRNAGATFFYHQNIKIGNALTNNIFTQTNFVKESATSNHVKAHIKILDKEKKPQVSTKIAYQVHFGEKKTINGNVVSDANGKITIPFEEVKPSPENFVPYITLSTTLSNGYTISKTLPIILNTPKLDAQFLPEGGNLINGLPCKIGIKVVNAQGLGENVTGIIVDNEGNEVTAFETTYLGMGSCILTPDAGKTYTAKIKGHGGVLLNQELPKTLQNGYQLAVNSLDSAKIDVKVLISEALLNNGQLRLIGQRSSNILFDITIPTQRQISSISIPRNKLPSGLVQLTLFNGNGNAVSERMVFNNNPQNNLSITTNGLKTNYGTREMVEINLLSTNESAPTQGSFSIAVTNATAIAPDEEEESNILSSMLLKSEVKGFIEKPNAYFATNSETNRGRIDNLMLTQAWRKISWEANTNNNNNLNAEKGISIRGNVTTMSKKPVSKAKVTLLFPNNKMVIASTEADENGVFTFDEIYLEGDNKFIVQAATTDGKKNLNVMLDKVKAEEVDQPAQPGLEKDVNFTLMNYLNASDAYFQQQIKNGSLEKTNLLKAVEIVAKKNTKEEMAAPHSTNYNGRGRADQVITEADFGYVPSLSDFIKQGRIRGVQDSAGYAINSRGRLGEQNQLYHPVLSVSLDGMILQNLHLEDIPITSIESIEVLINPALLTAYGTTVNDGLLIISTKRGKGRSYADIRTPGLVASTLVGYSPTKQFYSPKYDIKRDEVDSRITIYWNPQIVTDSKGASTFSFYNADSKGKYRMVIEGIDADGNLARKVLTYEVK